MQYDLISTASREPMQQCNLGQVFFSNSISQNRRQLNQFCISQYYVTTEYPPTIAMGEVLLLTPLSRRPWSCQLDNLETVQGHTHPPTRRGNYIGKCFVIYFFCTLFLGQRSKRCLSSPCNVSFQRPNI